MNIADAAAMQITDLAAWVRSIDDPSVGPLLQTLQQTLDSFVDIGLGYLSLDRSSGTLSGGEAQRTKMIRHLGSSLTDMTYVFDEPTTGLHPHDIQRMNELLLLLRDKGNTVLAVEHKPEVIAIADHVVDLGRGAGRAGGHITYEGDVAGLRASDTATGRHLDHRAALKPATRERTGVREIRGATLHNLRGVDVDVPLGITRCELCEGSGFSDDVLDYTLDDKNIAEVLAMSVDEAASFVAKGPAQTILGRMTDVGLGYLTLGQSLNTLSGGERQRLTLAISMAKKGAVYVLDEPTTGLHLADVEALLGLMDRLVDAGNSLIVIEHHQAVMAHADWIIDVGPGAGRDGGTIVFEGTPADLVAGAQTLTAEHLARYVGA